MDRDLDRESTVYRDLDRILDRGLDYDDLDSESTVDRGLDRESNVDRNLDRESTVDRDLDRDLCQNSCNVFLVQNQQQRPMRIRPVPLLSNRSSNGRLF